VPDSFVHLHVHTEYSMLDGASRVEDVFAEAARMGMPALAITDHGVMYGAVDFYQAGLDAGVKPILGAELYVATRSRFDKDAREKDGNHHLTAIATNETGYRNLMKLVTLGSLEGYYYRPRVDKELLAEHAEGIVATSGCLAGEVGQLLLRDQVARATEVAATYRDIFGPDNFYVELQDHGLADQKTVFPHLVDIARATGAPLLATNDLHYVRKGDAAAHDALLCIQTGSTMDEPNRFKFDAEEFYLKSPDQMRVLFEGYPDACDNTLAIAERCDVSLEFDVHRLPSFETPTGEPAEAYLRRLVAEGAAKRYGSPPPAEVGARIDYELGAIVEMGFVEYFLIVADLISFAKSSGIRVGPGRGSAGGSVVSYALGIVDIDPIRWGLIFERFLNPGRKEMPDIDMDFDERRRGEVIAYATRRYGEDHVAQIITFATIKGKQAIRDAARVLGMPYAVGDRLAKMYPPSILGKDPPLAACFEPERHWPDPGRNDAYPQATDLRDAYQTDADAKKVIDIARDLEGLRRQASVHAAGVVISDRPLVEYLPLRRDDSAGGVVTQYEMNAVARLGLLKMDFLGLRNLTVITDTLRHLERRGTPLDVDAIPLDDAETYAMLCAGDTIGVFQLESPGMRELVKRLLPDNFDDVMALVALYRPGPLGEGMHREYAARKHGESKIRYAHEDLKPILSDTYGVILYQEQVLRIASDMAGFSLPEADGLRKAMGKKIAEVMRAQREKFVTGCQQKGYDLALAEYLWEQIDKFSGYGFNKSHSCGYGLVAYQTAYLKAHHPVEYFAALLTSVKDKTDRAALYLAECRAMGITVEPPDVNHSEADFTPTDRGTIRYGLAAVRYVGESVVEKIVAARTAKGAFGSFVDFTAKVDPICLNRKVVESLACAGAFDALGVPRHALLREDAEKGLVIAPEVAQICEGATADARAREAGQGNLFGSDSPVGLAVEPQPGPPVANTVLLAAEKEMLGFYVSDHPLLSVEQALLAQTDTPVVDVEEMRDQTAVTVGGLVTRLQKRFTKKGEPMATFTLEDLKGAIEVVVFPSSYTGAQDVLKPDAIVVVRGKVDTREDRAKVVAFEVSALDPGRAAPPATPGGDGAAPPPSERAPRAPGKSRRDVLVLSVAAASCTPRLVASIRSVLEAHPGGVPVHLRLTGDDGGKTLRLPDRFKVERRTGLYAEIKALLGPRALVE